MAVSQAMLRLLHIRELEEEQSRAALEQALAELNRLEQAIRNANEHEREGRRLVVQSAKTGQLWERFTGLTESRIAKKQSKLLSSQLGVAADEVAKLREKLVNKRVERRQAETLVEEARAHQAIENARHEQQSLDEWFRNRQDGKPDEVSAAAVNPLPESE
jgi:flagellar export protein FliJ